MSMEHVNDSELDPAEMMCGDGACCGTCGEGERSHISLSKDHGPAHLRAVRQNTLDMTQEQFAVLMGISVATVRNWERGQTPIPPYFECALKMIESDPQMAMACLGAGRSHEEPAETGWDVVHPGPKEHARKMAVDKLKSNEDFKRMMDLAEGLKAFADEARVLGYDFDRKDVLGLAILSELTRIRKGVDY